MPHQSRSSVQEAAAVTSFGQVIEYIQGTLSSDATPSLVASKCISLTCPRCSSQIVCTSHHTRTRPTRARRSHTQQNRAGRHTSPDHHEPKQVHSLQQPPRSTHHSTSPSTTPCSTMPSTPTLARSTSVICTALPFSFTKCLDTPTTRTDPWYSGVTLIREVSVEKRDEREAVY